MTSSGGGLIQLVAYGDQDIYLTGNPQITFWKNIYRMHTNFSMEETISGTADRKNDGTAKRKRERDEPCTPTKSPPPKASRLA